MRDPRPRRANRRVDVRPRKSEPADAEDRVDAAAKLAKDLAKRRGADGHRETGHVAQADGSRSRADDQHRHPYWDTAHNGGLVR